MDFSDDEQRDMFDQAVDAGDILEGSIAYGIGLMALDQGYNALSPRQKQIFNTAVQPHLAARSDKREIEDRCARWPE